jgi:predicted cupin superfamily sugar epimerase
MDVRSPTENNAQSAVERLGLQPHPEGGWYRETWRGSAEGDGERGTGTAILFLLEDGQRSQWHRVDATELWLYHAGAPLRLFTAPSDRSRGATEHRLGPNVMGGDQVQHVISPGEWQAAEAIGGWCLVSCVVVPAFEFSGFELAPEGWYPRVGGDGAPR